MNWLHVFILGSIGIFVNLALLIWGMIVMVSVIKSFIKLKENKE